MAITAEQRNELMTLVVGMFDAAPSATLLTEFVNAIDSGYPLASLAEDFSATGEFQSLYPVWLTNEEFAERFATNLLDGNTSAAILDSGVEFVLAQLEAGASRGQAMSDTIAALAGVPESDADFGQAAKALNNKVEVATEFATTYLDASSEFATLQSVVANVTASDSTVTDQLNLLSEDFGAGATYLTSGQDILKGTIADDLFVARGNGSLDNSDIIDGGAGTDTLRVMLDSGETAEAPMTQNVEILEVTAQANNDSSGSNDVDGNGIGDDAPDIDAQDMDGVEEFWSVDSRSDLIIEDVRRDSTETTIGLRQTDPGDDVDFGLYFSPDNIVAPSSTNVGGQVFIELIDFEQVENDADPYSHNLVDLAYTGFTFRADGQLYSIDYGTDPDFALVSSHADLAALMNNALSSASELDANGDPLGTTVDLSGQLEIVAEGVFTATSSDDITYNDLPLIVMRNQSSTDAAEFVASDSQWLVDGTVPGDTNYHSQISDESPDTFVALTQTDIIFDYVGRGSKSGDVQIGSMSTGDSSGSAGIEQFNIDVDRNSWIDSLQSTNGSLEVINVENIGANGSLRIDYIEDVRVFDADTSAAKLSSEQTGMLGDVTLTAVLTEEVAEKYLARKDDDADASADNSDVQYNYVVDNEFSYDFGEGNDSLNLYISSDNLQVAGSATHEDFVLEVMGGAGDDELTVAIDSNGGAGDAWYENQKINSNITINGDAGNDTIRTGEQAVAFTPFTSGSGDFTVDGGAGADTVYLDNTGADFDWNSTLDDEDDRNNGNAAWVLNAVNEDIHDLQSNTASSVSAVNMAVTVSFKGFEAVVDLDETIGSLTDVTVTDLRINQAIKEAINNDAVLSKLLSAEDGPGRTLTIQSLIDGEMVDGDLSIDLTASTTALTAAQVSAGATAYSDALSLLDNVYEDGLVFGEDGGDDLEGEDSEATQDSSVNGGTADGANDVIVLGTGESSNDTVVWAGFGNGTDTVVNFSNEATTTVTSTISSTATGEIYTLTFSDGGNGVGAETITLSVTGTYEDGVTTSTYTESMTATLDAGGTSVIPGIDVAENFASTLGGSFSVLNVDGATVTVQATGSGNMTDLTAADFGGSYITNGGSVSVNKVSDGSLAYAAAVYETFTVDFDGSAASTTGSMTFDGATISYEVGDGLMTLAAAVAAGNYDNYDAVDNGDGTVSFTATVEGNLTEGIATDFNHGTDNITAFVSAGTDGNLGAVGSQTVVTTVIGNQDYIDFTAYGAVNVTVDGSLIEGVTASTDGEDYIVMTESATNDGEYEIELFEYVAGGADTSIGVIGVADFGEEQDFNSDTFII